MSTDSQMTAGREPERKHAMTAEPKIELIKPEGPFAKGDHFGAGERVILVNGVRWGRTTVTRHGRHGTKHTFQQEGGDTIMKPDKMALFGDRYAERVWSMNRLRSRGEWQSTDDLVLARVRELVAAGHLRDPDIVRAEKEARVASYQAARSARQEKEDAEFRRKAIEALGLNDDNGSPVIDRVIAAMRWAQDK